MKNEEEKKLIRAENSLMLQVAEAILEELKEQSRFTHRKLSTITYIIGKVHQSVIMGGPSRGEGKDEKDNEVMEALEGVEPAKEKVAKGGDRDAK